MNYKLLKGEVTIKQVDFEIRNYLMKNYGLYTSKNNGSITIKLKGNTDKKFDLNKQLTRKEMEETVNTGNIQEIKIELR